ncbi:MAG: FHA domain-containing protein [Fuerstiella sp.]
MPANWFWKPLLYCLVVICDHPFFGAVAACMLAQLVPVKGGAPITLTKPITVVGRSPRTCDLALNHRNVSKVHCVLVKTDGLIYIRDLGSTNGTRVNGQKVLRGALLPDDRISFSGAAYRVHLGPDPQLSSGDISSARLLGPLAANADTPPEMEAVTEDVVNEQVFDADPESLSAD